MRLKNYLMSLSLLLLISGCSIFQEKEEELSNFTDEVIEIEASKPEKSEKLNMSDVYFTVISSDGLKEKIYLNPDFSEDDEQWQDLKKYIDNGLAIITITSRDYENLSLNMADIVRYIKQQKQIILYYEKVIDNRDSNDESTDTSE